MKERVRVQRKATETPKVVSARQPGDAGETQGVRNAVQTGGRPLDAETQAVMSARFGHDFSRVRVHTDTQASDSAAALRASAYTVGPDVVFRQGQYAPETREGQRLIAHELTHVVQQSQTSVPTHAQGGLAVAGPNTPAEREAQTAAGLANAGRAVQVQSAGSNSAAIQRAPEDDKKPTAPEDLPPTPTSTGALPSDPAAAAAPPAANALVAAMFQSGVIDPVQRAHDGLAEKKPNLQTALSNLTSAELVNNSMVGPVRASGDELTATQVIDTGNLIFDDMRFLNEHMGHPLSVADIRDDLDASAPLVKRLEQIKGNLK